MAGRGVVKPIYRAMIALLYYWRDEYTRIFRDAEVLVFFLLLPTAYPILYALIYNPEVVVDVPVAVVDESRTVLSREIVRNFDATPAARIVSHCANLDEARLLMMQRDCYAILVISADITDAIARGEQATLVFYTDMSLLLNYKSLYMALTEVTLDMDVTLRQQALPIGVSNSIMNIAQQPVSYASVVMFNPTSGVASFLIPAVLVLILQQSLILGIGMLAAVWHEKGRGWYAPHRIWAQLCARTLCYVSIYIFNIVYLFHFVPWVFGYEQLGSAIEIFLWALPMTLSSIFMAITLSVWVREREYVYLLFVFTSVVFIFLSGIAWPRYAMPEVWRYLSYMIPSTWGIECFVQMNTMGATLAQASHAYVCLWILTLIYAATAYITMRYESKK